MSGFLRALEKVGLIEVDGKTQQAATNPESYIPVVYSVDNQSAKVPISPPSLSVGSISEGQPFAVFYTHINSGPYPAEKMLKLIDGLVAMDPSTRLAAVKAMDEADDSWTIEDAVADAKAKIKALTGQASIFTAQVTAIEKDTEASIKSLEDNNNKSVTAIRNQISELEALLARQIEKNGGDKAAAQNELQAAREACTRETGRLHSEVSRLNVLVDMFGAESK
jgi:lysozyme family protein